ncbi:ApeI family dehydratase [Mesoterricola silvestris]|uniref:ApeI dehydratase-like domain-containing protein n=1 Tax=Mesoterricola silvestris TaxID=2927979 RepID=A0AA48K8L9_9BACT|nr:hypothetical protein [Mesoterricola silvestris]BDU71452.1 hypothetical protein METEAL_06260 [Mesoterricola silvestris]
MRFPASARVAPAGPEGSAAFALELDPELLGFQGHFPGNPILPGVVQVDWAIHFAEAAFGPLGAFRGLEHLKFTDIVRPGQALTLTLALDPARESLRFAFQDGDTRKACGIIHFQGNT